MADNLTKSGGESSDKALTNATARIAMQNDTFKKLLAKEREIDREMEKHIQPLKDDKKALWKALREALDDIELEDLKLAYKIYAREQQAYDFMDAEDRDRVLGNLEEIFNNLKKGQMLNFLTALDMAAGGGGDDDDDAPAADQGDAEDEAASAAVH